MTSDGFTTRLLHQGKPQHPHGATHAPVQYAVPYAYPNAQALIDVFQGKSRGYRYSRQGHPTASSLEDKITQLEQGVGTISFSTGMAAIGAIFQAFLNAGDHIVASQFLFGNTFGLLQTLARYGFAISLVDPTDADAIRAAWRPTTRFVLVEAIANPMTQIPHWQALQTLSQQHGACLIVDNTLTSAALFCPKTVGAGLVVNSLTKYIAGHGAALGGSVTDTGVIDWQQWRERIPSTYQSADPAQWGLATLRAKGLRDFGATLSPDSAHRILLGLETLELRTAQHNQNARALAQLLDQHSAVKRVYHPSLGARSASPHPQHERAQQYFSDFGALLSVELHTNDPCATMNRLRLPLHSTHIGDTRTLIIAVAQTIYHDMGVAQRTQMGIAESLIRISVGIENTDDLCADFQQALDHS